MAEAAVAFLLVLLAAVRVGAARVRRWLPLAFVAGLGAAVVAHHHLARPLGMVIDAQSTQLVLYAGERLRKAVADPTTEVIVVVNGASVTARGVDGQLLETRLRRLTGLRVAVVQVSLAGANHIERRAIARSLVEELPGELRRRLAAIPLLVLWEVHRGYDTALLAQLEENRRTARAFAYLDLEGATLWLRAAASANRPALRKQALDAAPEVAWHAGVSTFRVGSSQWFTSRDAIQTLAGFNPEDRLKERARVVGLSKNVERMGAFESAGAPRYVDTQLVPGYLRAFGNPRTEIIFFSPPSRDVGHMAYANQFCRDHADTVCIGFRNRALLESLDHRRFWVDGSHLAPAGAEIYTRWLADVLSRAMIRHEIGAPRDT